MMFFQLRICLFLLVGVGAALSAGQVNAVVLYQENFEGWTNGTVLETAGVGTIDWTKFTTQDSVEVTSNHGTLDGKAADGSTQSQAANGYGKYRVAHGSTAAHTMTVDLYTTANSFENLLGFSPGLALVAGAGGWEFRSPGNAAVPLGGVAGLDTRVTGLISVTGESATAQVYAQIVRFSDNVVLGSTAGLISDTTGGHLGLVNYWQHSGASRTDRQGFDIDNILIVSGFVPEPSTCVLFGLGLVGLAGCGRRKRN